MKPFYFVFVVFAVLILLPAAPAAAADCPWGYPVYDPALRTAVSPCSSGVAASSAGRDQVPFKGTLKAVEQDIVQGPTLSVDGRGAGYATHLGAYTMTYKVKVNLSDGSAAASMRMVAANGDEIRAEGPGQGSPTADPNISRIVENYTITGGTGRFAGATGSYAVKRTINLVTGATAGGFTGTLSLR
jgi:hypothetical protein